MGLNVLGDYTKQNIIKDKTAVEAGYVNNKDDSGGETNHGITAKLAAYYEKWLRNQFQWDGTMRNLSVEMAYWVYDTEFWAKIRGDELHQRHPLIADKVFDVAINCGSTVAITHLQEILTANNNRGKLYPDLKPDGAIGKLTFSALDSYISIRKTEGIQRLLCALLAEQGHYYLDLVKRREKDEEFYYGWTGRVARDMGHYAKLIGIAI